MKLKGLNRVRSKGRTYLYHRATGEPFTQKEGTTEFLEEYLKFEKNQQERSTNWVAPDSLGALIDQYRESDKFKSLAPRTRKDYNKVLDYLEPIRSAIVSEIKTSFIQKLQDKTLKKRGRRFSRYVTQVFQALFTWGKPRGLTNDNPAYAVEVPPTPFGHKKKEVNRPWEPQERDVVLGTAPLSLKVPIMLGMFCGLREGDVLTADRDRFKDGKLSLYTAKSDGENLIWWPVPRPVRDTIEQYHAELDEMAKRRKRQRPLSTKLAPNSFGAAYTDGGFRASFFKLIRRLEKAKLVRPGLTFHGLRHTVGDILADLGFDDRAIADALGQKTEAMARHYSRRAKLVKKMTAIAEAMENAEIERKKVLQNG